MDIKAIFLGLFLFFILHGVYLAADFLFLGSVHGSAVNPAIILTLFIAPYLSAIAAGGLSAYLSKKDKLFTSFLLSIGISICAGILNFVLPYIGLPGDHVDSTGAIIMGLLGVPYYFISSVFGGVIGIGIHGKIGT